MSERSQNTSDNQEIDLTQISNNISSFFEGVSAKIFRGILFIKRNLVLLFLLFIIVEKIIERWSQCLQPARVARAGDMELVRHDFCRNRAIGLY